VSVDAHPIPATEAPPGLDEAAELLRALGHPLRLHLVHELQAGARCVHELVSATGASQPLVSQHLRVLRSARLIAASRRGREVAYRLTDEHVSHIAADAIRHGLEPDADAN
jgi:DNA-binding transcriptional ArsR family regulator